LGAYPDREQRYRQNQLEAPGGHGGGGHRIHKKGTGDNAGKTYANLSFDGYENIDAATVTSPGPGGATGPEAYADI